jgi:6-O-methylguanine DNA methyltransferase, ribonuclease-like domain
MHAMHETCYTYLESPVGRLLIAGNQTGLQWIGFPEGKGAKEPEAGWIMSDTDLRETMRQLEAYFSGKLRDFNLPLSPDGTPFHIHLRGDRCGNWQTLRRPGRRCGQRPEPVADCDSLPPGNRQQRRSYGIWWRPPDQTDAACAGEPATRIIPEQKSSRTTGRGLTPSETQDCRDLSISTPRYTHSDCRSPSRGLLLLPLPDGPRSRFLRRHSGARG